MPKIPTVADPVYLRSAQYKDSGNLRARIALHRRFSTNAYGWSPWVFDQLLSVPNLTDGRPRSILEIGGGAGTLWTANASRIPSQWHICLSDFSAGMLADARRALDATVGRFELLLADAQAIPFASRCFDVVIANHMLYHVADRPVALREIRRVLTDDGCLLAATIGTAHLQEIDEWLRQIGIDMHGWGIASTQAFSLENGTAQIAAAFGQVDERRYDDSLLVTEVEPIMAYIASMRAGSALSDAAAAELRSRLTAQIAEHGHVHITKVSGLFLAHHERTRRRQTR